MSLPREVLSNKDIARQERVMAQTVGKWRRRYLTHGMDELFDEPRPGQPRRITDKDVERVIVTTLENRPENATHWSTRSLAAKEGLNQTAVSRIWRAFSLQQHRQERFKLSKGPLFVEKVRDIVRLYLDPPDKALVLCVDKKSQIHLILDNHGTHKSPILRSWLRHHPRFHFHFTPTGSSWINLVECWFAEITNKWMRRGAHRGTAELERAIYQYIETANQDPRPFIWTKTSDPIFASIKRYLESL